ncbi:hypothetical protein [Colwellia demingiae]|uniref:hypothetical protein n=1 Tax=Colwellia demingiae TaxID=89401 RepID=UPI003CCC6763
MAEYVFPNKEVMHQQVETNGWNTPPLMKELQQKVRDAGLWNLFLPTIYGKYSSRLTNLDYVPLAEIMGYVHWGPEVFNCAAPDTGNMEVLAK